MTDQDAHVATPDEDALYEALTAGDNDTINEMRAESYGALQVPNEDGLTPRQVFDLDYFNAWTHYQADNEMPESEREDNTAAHADEHNDTAAAAEAST